MGCCCLTPPRNIVNININGTPAFFGSRMPIGGMFSPGCFGFGYGGFCGDMFGFGNPFSYGMGMGLGYACAGAMPGLFNAVGKGCDWLWNKAIKPAFNFVGKGISFVWNKGIVPAAKAVGKGVSSAVKWVGNGVKNLWNKIFHKSKNA